MRDIRRAGSAALDLAWVACGRLDGFFESGIQHWDYAGGMLLVHEAGGRFAVGPGPHDGILQVVASAPGIHGALRALALADGLAADGASRVHCWTGCARRPGGSSCTSGPTRYTETKQIRSCCPGAPAEAWPRPLGAGGQ